MTIAAILSGCNGWNEIEDYGYSKHAWFKSFLTLPSGIPSHDTFNRVFSALDPAELEKGFVAWVSSIAKLTAGEVVAIDGKTLRGGFSLAKESLVARATISGSNSGRERASLWGNSEPVSTGTLAEGEVLGGCSKVVGMILAPNSVH